MASARNARPPHSASLHDHGTLPARARTAGLASDITKAVRRPWAGKDSQPVRRWARRPACWVLCPAPANPACVVPNSFTMADLPLCSSGRSAVLADQAAEDLPGLDPGGDVDSAAGLTQWRFLPSAPAYMTKTQRKLRCSPRSVRGVTCAALADRPALPT